MARSRPDYMPENYVSPRNKDGTFKKGYAPFPFAQTSKKAGPTFMGTIKRMLRTPVYKMLKQTDDELAMERAARSFIKRMFKGSFAHAQEIINREEGKVPQRIADAEGKPVKMYIGMPTEGDDAP